MTNQQMRDAALAGVDVRVVPIPGGTRVDVVAPPEIWAMLAELAEREGTTADEIMRDMVGQSLLRANRLADEGGLPDAIN